MAGVSIEDLEGRVDSLAEEVELRLEKLQRRIRALEADLDDNAWDLEYTIDRVQRACREAERKARGGW